LQGPSSPNPVTFINFVDGDDNPWWTYTLTLQPGEPRIIATFGVAQPSRAAAAPKAAQLAGLPDNATQCLTTAERAVITNFAPPAPPVPTLGQTGLVALGLLLAVGALMILRRRSAVAEPPRPCAATRAAPRGVALFFWQKRFGAYSRHARGRRLNRAEMLARLL